MPKDKFLTASSFPLLMKNDKKGTGPAQTAMAVIERHAIEMLGVKYEEIELVPCIWGIENESNAFIAYEKSTLSRPKKALFKISPTLSYVGGTMDGLVGSNGGIEIKCPYNPTNHIKITEQIKNYFYQIQGYIWIYELDWIDFVSYDPRYPAEYCLCIKRMERDDKIIKSLEERCEIAHNLALKIVDEVKFNYAQ